MKVWVITSAKFPDGDAEALRIQALSKIFLQLGFDIEVLSYGNGNYLKKNNFGDIKYRTLKKKSPYKVVRIVYFFAYTIRLISFLKSQSFSKDDIILGADIRNSAIKYTKKFAKKQGIIFIYDSVEWFSPSQFKFGKFDMRYQFKRIENVKLLDSSVRIIAISTYLEKYFSSKGCQVERIPVILECNIQEIMSFPNERKILTYAGFPGKKDYVDIMLKGISLLSSESLRKIEFNFVGFQFEDVSDYLTEIEREIIIKNCIFHGRVSHSDTLELIRKSDFTMLLRNENEIYAKAGFPTKVVESLTMGIPIVCNYSSDLSLYLKDNKEIILVKDSTNFAFCEALEYISQLERNKIDEMKKNAMTTALKYFDYNNYINNIKRLISKN